MNNLIEFAAVFFSSILSHINGMVQSIKNPDSVKKNSAYETALKEWIPAVTGIAVVALVALMQPGGLNSIGINLEVKAANFAAAVEGFCWFAAILILVYFIYRFGSGRKRPNEFEVRTSDRPEIVETAKFRSGLERLVYFSILPVCVIAEEFVYRGYLVLLLGSRSGTCLPWALFSVALSVIVHLYQGRDLRNILIHLLLATSLVGITMVTKNLFASIIGHLFNNLAFTFNIWRLADHQGLVPAEEKPKGLVSLFWILFALVNLYLVLAFFVWTIDIRFSIK
jgi:membrane protease YdiL (CAAX protease family)